MKRTKWISYLLLAVAAAALAAAVAFRCAGSTTLARTFTAVSGGCALVGAGLLFGQRQSRRK